MVGIKVCVRYIFAAFFVNLKGEHLRNKENIFYFTSKALFVLEIIIFYFFKVFKCHDVIKCPKMKQKTYLLNNLVSKHSPVMKFDQFM